jgi:hypothetical protein
MWKYEAFVWIKPDLCVKLLKAQKRTVVGHGKEHSIQPEAYLA